ncbi:MAG: hypothetical protein R3275_09095, partial [Saprospiraceae bacterium]|nr:hypothetical protein [Saprospiraceae bacterium]
MQASSISHTIEKLIDDLGYDASASRKGSFEWEVREGSAHISIAYHQNSGMIIAETYLCGLGEKVSSEIFQFLLQQNEDLRGLTFSLKEGEVVLSTLIY